METTLFVEAASKAGVLGSALPDALARSSAAFQCQGGDAGERAAVSGRAEDRGPASVRPTRASPRDHARGAAARLDESPARN